MGKQLLVPLALVVVLACDRSPTAPLADALACPKNPVALPARFTIIRDGVRDAVPTENRIVVPHHWSDTMFVAASSTAPPMLIILGHPGYCTTLLDSLIFLAPRAWDYDEG